MSTKIDAGKLLNKLDPKQIMDLANTIITTHKDLSELKIKAETFVLALAEHEKSSRFALKEQTQQYKITIAALEKSLPLLTESEHKLKALEFLVKYGSEAMKQLGETSKDILETLPTQPKMIE